MSGCHRSRHRGTTEQGPNVRRMRSGSRAGSSWIARSPPPAERPPWRRTRRPERALGRAAGGRGGRGLVAALDRLLAKVLGHQPFGLGAVAIADRRGDRSVIGHVAGGRQDHVAIVERHDDAGQARERGVVGRSDDIEVESEILGRSIPDVDRLAEADDVVVQSLEVDLGRRVPRPTVRPGARASDAPRAVRVGRRSQRDR